jgi:hypothetical protein
MQRFAVNSIYISLGQGNFKEHVMKCKSLLLSVCCTTVILLNTAHAADLNTINTYPVEARPAAVYEFCKNSDRMVGGYDCACVRDEFRSRLSTSAPDATTHSLLSAVLHAGSCRSEKAYANSTKKECVQRFFIYKSTYPQQNLQQDSFCSCLGKKAAALFVNDPNGRIAASSKGQQAYKSKAISKCIQ